MLVAVGADEKPPIEDKPEIGAGLSPLQLRTLEGLMDGRTYVQIAKEVGINRGTISDWMNGSAEFQAAYRYLKAEQFNNLSRRLLAMADRAVDAYGEVLEGPGMAGAFTLTKTADSILTQVFKLKEILDVDERLAEIEARLREVDRDYE